MSNDKAIIYGKSKRKPYRGGKAIARSCRNHGSCEYCLGNRRYQTNKQLGKIKDQYYDLDSELGIEKTGTIMQ